MSEPALHAKSSLLAQGLHRLGLSDAGRELPLLESYAGQIALWNRRTNLVRASGDDLVIRHLLDSLAAVSWLPGLPHGGLVADVGSGAGLPGIPLAIALPHLRFVLIERAGLRASFLRACAAVLPLPNVEVLEADVTTLLGRLFPLVVFRAFRPLARSLAEVTSITAPGSVVAAYAGRGEGLKEQAAAMAGQFALTSIVPLEVPFLAAERHLVLLKRL